MVAQRFLSLCIGVILATSVHATCDDDELSCETAAIGARQGSAMLQSASVVKDHSDGAGANADETQAKATGKSKSSPLVGKVGVLEKVVTSLQQQVMELEDNVGNVVPRAAATVAAPAATPVTAAPEVAEAEATEGSESIEDAEEELLDAEDEEDVVEEAAAPVEAIQRHKAHRKRRMALTQSDAGLDAKTAETLKKKVKKMESEVAGMISRTGSLENEIYGDVQASSVPVKGPKANLKNRILHVEAQVNELKLRVTNLQHDVLG